MVVPLLNYVLVCSLVEQVSQLFERFSFALTRGIALPVSRQLGDLFAFTSHSAFALTAVSGTECGVM
jgi:hypothetical protein